VRYPEQDIQKAIVRFIRLQYPNAIVYAIPNGGNRGKTMNGILKGMGVMAGAPDLCVLWKVGRVGFLEVKSMKGRLAVSQKLFASRCEQLGIPCACVKSVTEAQEVLKSWDVGRYL